MNQRKNVYIKVSGDEFQNPSFLLWIKELVQTSWVVICIGGGTQINEAFIQQGFPVQLHGPMGREMETFSERQLQRTILEQNQKVLQDALAEMNIFVSVEIPILSIGTVLCPVNGDQMIRTAYLGFDELYVVTTSDRKESKQKMFANLPKVMIKAFN